MPIQSLNNKKNDFSTHSTTKLKQTPIDALLCIRICVMHISAFWFTTTTTTDKDSHPDHLWRTSKTSSYHIEDQVQCQTSEDIEMSASVAQCTQQCYNKIELSRIRVDTLSSVRVLIVICINICSFVI